MARAAVIQWGPWTFERDSFSLVYTEGRTPYCVDLRTCTDSAQVLDWIMQVEGRYGYGVASFVTALRYVLHPQANMCRSGTNRRINPREVAASNGYESERPRRRRPGRASEPSRQRRASRPTSARAAASEE